MVAERGGFEPPVQFNPYGSLANYWFKPLTHLSVFRAANIAVCPILRDPGWIRTNGRLLRRQVLYPAELRDQVQRTEIHGTAGPQMDGATCSFPRRTEAS